MTRADRADFAVIGGGPAGAATCVALGRLGRKPLWITPRPPAGDRIGESLSPAANPILIALGLGHVLASPAHRRANATFSAWGSDRLIERSAYVHLEGPGLLLDRPAFEAEMRTAAMEAGAVPMEAPLRAAKSEGGLWHLRLADGSERTARFLLDCSGRKALVGRRMARRRSADRLVAAYAFLDQDDPEVEPTPATLVEAVPDGWWYAALLPRGNRSRRRMAIAHFTDPDLLPRRSVRDPQAWHKLVSETAYVGRWIESAGFDLAGPPTLASAGTSWLEPAAAPDGTSGWAAVGDAAAAFNPLSSHGLTTALWSAKAAAEAAVAAVAGDHGPLAKYAAAMARGVADFQAQHTAVHAQERRFADRTFWIRRRIADQGRGLG